MATRIINSIISVTITMAIVSLLINSTLFFKQYEDIKKFERTVIFYGQKNGGFVDSSEVSFNTFYKQIVEDLNLKDAIVDITFYPSIGTKVNKKEKYTVTVVPKFKVMLPFASEYFITGSKISRTGVGHKYFKNL